jgi:hypothetical protein
MYNTDAMGIRLHLDTIDDQHIFIMLFKEFGVLRKWGVGYVPSHLY